MQLEHKATLTLSKGILIYKTLIFVLDFPHYIHICKKKDLPIFCVTNECDSDFKECHFLLKQMVTKKKVWHKQECD